MDIKEIVNNEEVVETTEEIMTAGSGKSFQLAAGIGLVVLVGVIAYRYVAKPILAKIKAEKTEPEQDYDAAEAECDIKIVDEQESA